MIFLFLGLSIACTHLRDFEVELTLFQTNTNSFTAYAAKLFVHIEVELTLFQTNTNSFTAYTVKLFVHIEAELM